MELGGELLQLDKTHRRWMPAVLGSEPSQVAVCLDAAPIELRKL